MANILNEAKIMIEQSQREQITMAVTVGDVDGTGGVKVRRAGQPNPDNEYYRTVGTAPGGTDQPVLLLKVGQSYLVLGPIN